MIGMFCVDPGSSTGVAWAIVNEKSGSVVDAMNNRIDTGSTTITGTDIEQARRLFTLWSNWRVYCVQNRMLDPAWIELVAEDYVIRAGHKPERAPVSVRVLYAFEGYRYGRHDSHRTQKHIAPLILQLPSDAMKHNNQKRLRSWGAWVVGKEHERSAYAHMGTRLLKLTDKRRVG